MPNYIKSKKLSELNKELQDFWYTALGQDSNKVYPTKSYLWKCPKGHTFKRPLKNMIKTVERGLIKCPECAVNIYKFSKGYPHFIDDFHPTKNKPLTIETFYPWKEQKIWWKCREGHSWEETVKNRQKNFHTYGVSHCRKCNGLEIDKTNNLLDLYPEIAKEWDYEANKDLKPENIFYKNAGKSISWKCVKGHRWKTSVYHRTVNKSSCPHCRISSSLPEIRIYSELSFIFDDVKHRYKILKQEADIFIEEFKTIIEFDGWFYHKGSTKYKKDLSKQKIFESNGYNVIRFREGDLPKIGNCIYVEKHKLEKSSIDTLLKILKNNTKDKQHLKKIDYYLKASGFLNDKLYREIRDNLPAPPYKKSLAFLQPKISAEWDYNKNSPLKPEHFTENSGQKVHWICLKNNNHSGWETIISNRTSKKSGCPKCQFTLRKKLQSTRVKKRNLLNVYTNVQKYFDFEKNKMKVSDLSLISFASGDPYYWKCPGCKDAIHKSPLQFFRHFRVKHIKKSGMKCLKCGFKYSIKLKN